MRPAGIHITYGGVLFVISGTEVLAIIGLDYEVSLMIITGWIITMNDFHYDLYVQGVSY
jgi:hypothetical protein